MAKHPGRTSHAKAKAPRPVAGGRAKGRRKVVPKRGMRFK